MGRRSNLQRATALVAGGTANRTQSQIAIDHAKFYSRSHDGVIHVYGEMRHVNRLALAQLSRELCSCDLTKQRK